MEDNKVYVVSMKWNDDGAFDACVEKVCPTKQAADEYALRRFREELKCGKYAVCDEDDLNINEEYMAASIESDDYWFEFTIDEKEISK